MRSASQVLHGPPRGGGVAGAVDGGVSVPLVGVHEDEVAVVQVDGDAVGGEHEVAAGGGVAAVYGDGGEPLVEVAFIGVHVGGIGVVDGDGGERGAWDDPGGVAGGGLGGLGGVPVGDVTG